MNNLQAFKVKYTAHPDKVIRDLVRVLEDVDTGIEDAANNGGGSGGTFDPDDYVWGEVPSGQINGSNAAFTAAFDFDPSSLEVRYNGQQLRTVSDYVVTGPRNILLTFSPDFGDVIDADYKKLPGEEIERIVNGEVPSGVQNGANTVFTTQFPFEPGYLEVRLNGIQCIEGNDYSASGSQVTFVVPPDAADVIDVDYLKFIIP